MGGPNVEGGGEMNKTRSLFIFLLGLIGLMALYGCAENRRILGVPVVPAGTKPPRTRFHPWLDTIHPGLGLGTGSAVDRSGQGPETAPDLSWRPAAHPVAGRNYRSARRFANHLEMDLALPQLAPGGVCPPEQLDLPPSPQQERPGNSAAGTIPVLLCRLRMICAY